jgi:DNA-binding MarR family transcriptional regulator
MSKKHHVFKPDKEKPKRQHDFLKYYSFVKYAYRRKNDLDTIDFDVMLFLYSEGNFTKAKFNEFTSITQWGKRRFIKLIQEGWIDTLPLPSDQRIKYYRLSRKAVKMIGEVYNIITGEEILFHDKDSEKWFRRDTLTDKIFVNYIRELNGKSPLVQQRKAHYKKIKLLIKKKPGRKPSTLPKIPKVKTPEEKLAILRAKCEAKRERSEQLFKERSERMKQMFRDKVLQRTPITADSGIAANSSSASQSLNEDAL